MTTVWERGYRITKTALIAPSGEAIAHINRMTEGVSITPVSSSVMRAYPHAISTRNDADEIERRCGDLARVHAERTP